MSKGLLALKSLVGNKFFMLLGRTHGKRQLANDIDIIQKALKALDIIKEKRVNIDALIKYIKTNAVDDIPLCWYNEYIALFEEDRCLTQKEYDLLKEVLKWLS